MGCNCGNKGKTFLVTWSENGATKTATKTSEIEAKGLARRTGGSYKVQ